MSENLDLTRDEAAAALTQAIANHGAAMGNVPSGAMLDTFVVVAHWVEPDGEQGYSMHYPTDTLPLHTVVGLLETGGDMVRFNDEETP